MLTIFAALAELERETILQRQREGIAIAKQQGKYKGRKAIPYDEDPISAVILAVAMSLLMVGFIVAEFVVLSQV